MRETPALKYLQELRFAKTKAEHPNFPYPVKKKYSDTTANALTAAVVDFINLSGGIATRISSEGRYLPSKGIRIPSNTKKGVADVHAVYKGLHLSIEIKIGKDKQSPAQVEMQNRVEAAGGHYYIAKDFQSFYDWITKL